MKKNALILLAVFLIVPAFASAKSASLNLPWIGGPQKVFCKENPTCCRNINRSGKTTRCTLYRSRKTLPAGLKAICNDISCSPIWTFTFDRSNTLIEAKLKLMTVDGDREMFRKQRSLTRQLIQLVTTSGARLQRAKSGISWARFDRLRRDGFGLFKRVDWQTRKLKIRLSFSGVNSHHPVLTTSLRIRLKKSGRLRRK